MQPLAILLLASGCSEPLALGSNVLWSSDHETGDLSAWTQGDEGGAYAHGTATAYDVVDDQAHSGSYSVKLTAPADGTDTGPGLFRHWHAPEEAYYSAWYYLPRAYDTVSYWTILQLRSTSPAEPTSGVDGINLNLRSLPDGRLVLTVVQQRQAYLAWPLALPTPFVPVQQWFQLEVKFLNAADETGRYKIWLDGNLTYDIEGRVTAQSEELYFTLCNVTNTMTPAPVDIYVDDAMVSLSRATPAGRP